MLPCYAYNSFPTSKERCVVTISGTGGGSIDLEDDLFDPQ